MSVLRGTTLAGTDTLLDPTAVTAFQARLRGHTHEAKPVTVSRSKQDSSLPTVLRWVT